MGTTSRDNEQFRQRVANHSMTGRATGFLDVLPPEAQAALHATNNVEDLIDVLARALGTEVGEVRRRNLAIQIGRQAHDLSFHETFLLLAKYMLTDDSINVLLFACVEVKQRAIALQEQHAKEQAARLGYAYDESGERAQKRRGRFVNFMDQVRSFLKDKPL